MAAAHGVLRRSSALLLGHQPLAQPACGAAAGQELLEAVALLAAEWHGCCTPMMAGEGICHTALPFVAAAAADGG